jgi:predicted HicB family RNase H-like nuclease
MAKKNTDYADKFKGFADKVKSEPVSTTIQKVMPVKQAKPKKEAETGFHVFIKISNLKALKLKALQEETSVKDLINRAIEGIL